MCGENDKCVCASQIPNSKPWCSKLLFTDLSRINLCLPNRSVSFFPAARIFETGIYSMVKHSRIENCPLRSRLEIYFFPFQVHQSIRIKKKKLPTLKKGEIETGNEDPSLPIVIQYMALPDNLFAV